MFNNKSHKDTDGSVNISNIIGKGSNVEGNIKTVGNLRIEGKFTGKMHVQAKVVLSHTAEVQGDILAQNAEIGGKVEGTIEVNELLVFKSTAVVNGNIVAAKLIFEEGAYFDGKCKMGKAQSTSKFLNPPLPSKQEAPPDKDKKNTSSLKLSSTH